MTNASVRIRSHKDTRWKTRNPVRKTTVIWEYGKESTGYTAAWYRANGIFDGEIRYSRIYQVRIVYRGADPWTPSKLSCEVDRCCFTALNGT